MSTLTNPEIRRVRGSCPDTYKGFSTSTCPSAQELPWGDNGSQWGDMELQVTTQSNHVAARVSPILDVKGKHGLFLSNYKDQVQQIGRGLVSEPALRRFWSNSLISLIEPNIYAFPCCSANIVRTWDFITSQKETSQDAPDESPNAPASSFSLLYPLIPFLSAASLRSSSVLVRLCQLGGLGSDSKALLLLGISFTLSPATLEQQPDSDPIYTHT